MRCVQRAAGVVTLMLALILAAGAVTAEIKVSKTERLDALFVALKAAPSEAEARSIEADIWALWNASGRADVDSMMRQAQEFAGRGLLKASLDELEEVIKLAPDYAEGWNRKATVLFMMGRNGESVVAIQRTLALEPRHFGALAGLGLIGLRSQNWKGALRAFERALELNPWIRERGLLLELRRKVEGRPL